MILDALLARLLANRVVTVAVPNYTVTPVAVYAGDEVCTGVNGTDIATLRVTDLGDGPRQFVIAGANQSIVANVRGSNSTVFVREPGIAFRILVQDKDTGVVYATYSLGRTISFEQPQAEIDRTNQLHVLHCAAPRAWSYARIGLNGELLTHSSFMETKTRPHLVHSGKGEIAVQGGMVDASAQGSGSKAPKLSARPPGAPTNDDR